MDEKHETVAQISFDEFWASKSEPKFDHSMHPSFPKTILSLKNLTIPHAITRKRAKMLNSARDVQGELHLVRHFLQSPAMAQHKLQRAYENQHQAHPKFQSFRKSAEAGIKQIRNFIDVEKIQSRSETSAMSKNENELQAYPTLQ